MKSDFRLDVAVALLGRVNKQDGLHWCLSINPKQSKHWGYCQVFHHKTYRSYYKLNFLNNSAFQLVKGPSSPPSDCKHFERLFKQTARSCRPSCQLKALLQNVIASGCPTLDYIRQFVSSNRLVKYAIWSVNCRFRTLCHPWASPPATRIFNLNLCYHEAWAEKGFSIARKFHIMVFAVFEELFA